MYVIYDFYSLFRNNMTGDGKMLAKLMKEFQSLYGPEGDSDFTFIAKDVTCII